MSYARQMLDTYPRTFNADAGLLAAAIDALSDCVQACNADNAADLGEQNVTEMVTCIRLCLDCADICTATIGVTSRQASYDANVTPMVAVQTSAQSRQSRMHVTISVTFCSLKSASTSAIQACAQSLSASMAAASTLASTPTVPG